LRKISTSHWKEAFTLITAMFLSVIGVKTAFATTKISKATVAEKPSLTPPQSNGETQLAQACPNESHHQSPRPYARVTTQGDPLNIRSSPNGRIIGSVPNRWEVVTLNRDATGKWTRITSHFGDVAPIGFASARRFSEGWVSTAHLKNLGRFCDKPMNLMRSELKTLSETKKLLIHEDWVEMGDRISRSIPKQ
jgi:hypothetical protein